MANVVDTHTSQCLTFNSTNCCYMKLPIGSAPGPCYSDVLQREAATWPAAPDQDLLGTTKQPRAVLKLPM